MIKKPTHPKIEIDLFKDWAFFIREKITDMGYTLPSGATDEEACIYYYEIVDRVPQQRPRKILKADTFTCPPEAQEGLSILESSILKGDDLRPRFSTGIQNAENFDGLLLDWGIHHLHLGIGDHQTFPGFVTRSGSLLYSKFTDDTAYFIGVFPHGKWSSQDLIRVIHHNWPDIISSSRITGIEGLSHVPSDEEIGRFRKAKINCSLEIEPGVFYTSLGAGITAAGTSGSAVRLLNDSRHFFTKSEDVIVKGYDDWKGSGENPEAKFDFSLLIENESFYAYSESQKFRIKIR